MGTNGHFAGTLKVTPQTVIEHHRLKYNILRLNSGKKIKALLFSSPTRGEGTSTVLINFAASLAADGDRVLLVDANLRNPSLHSTFALTERKWFDRVTHGSAVSPGSHKGDACSEPFRDHQRRQSLEPVSWCVNPMVSRTGSNP